MNEKLLNIGYLEDLDTGEIIEDIDLIEQYNVLNEKYLLERLYLEKCILTDDIIKNIEEHFYIFWFGNFLNINTGTDKEISYWLKNFLDNKVIPERIVEILKDANNNNDIIDLINQKSLKFLNCYLLNSNDKIKNIIFEIHDSIYKRTGKKTPFEMICN